MRGRDQGVNRPGLQTHAGTAVLVFDGVQRGQDRHQGPHRPRGGQARTLQRIGILFLEHDAARARERRIELGHVVLIRAPQLHFRR